MGGTVFSESSGSGALVREPSNGIEFVFARGQGRPLSEKGRELIGLVESQFIGDFLDAKGGGMQETFGFCQNKVGDRLFGRQTGIFLDKRIEVVGMHVEGSGIESDRFFRGVVFLYEGIEALDHLVINGLLLYDLSLCEKPVTLHDEFEDFDGEHFIFPDFLSFIFFEEEFENGFQFLFLIV
jgi:hypothetical protein